jgi:hypothetical protein
MTVLSQVHNFHLRAIRVRESLSPHDVRSPAIVHKHNTIAICWYVAEGASLIAYRPELLRLSSSSIPDHSLSSSPGLS